MEITQNCLYETFSYKKEGFLVWSVNKAPKKIGDVAGTIQTNKNGKKYKKITLNRKCYLEHRLIFLFHHGYLPEQIDHIDGNGLNNKIENLREATSKQNARNRKIPSNNKSGHTGVCWDKKTKKWFSYIRVDGFSKTLGRFVNIEDAIQTRKKFESIYFGDYVRKT